MTAWGVGFRRAELSGLDSVGGLGAFVGKVISWIPADVVALYGVAVTTQEATRTHSGSNPNTGLLVTFIVLAPIVAWAGAFAAPNRKFTWRDLVAGILAFFGFAIWSTSVPRSGWGGIDWVQQHPTDVAIGAAVAGLVFSLIASGVDRRVPDKPIIG
jgi:hypothetical protein